MEDWSRLESLPQEKPDRPVLKAGFVTCWPSKPIEDVAARLWRTRVKKFVEHVFGASPLRQYSELVVDPLWKQQPVQFVKKHCNVQTLDALITVQ